jgi:hypothetical protein
MTTQTLQLPDAAFETLLKLNPGWTRSTPGVTQTFAAYAASYAGISGAPEPSALTPADIPAVQRVHQCAAGADWNTFREACCAEAAEVLEAGDLFMPIWGGKTEEGNPWTQDTKVGVDSPKRADIDRVLRRYAPSRHMDFMRRLEATAGRVAPGLSVLEAMSSPANRRLFIQPMGDTDGSDWRVARDLTFFGGLGIPGIRALGAAYRGVDTLSGHYATAAPSVFEKDLFDARGMSGYPLGLILADAAELCEIFEGTAVEDLPAWLPKVVALHLLKYTRLDSSRESGEDLRLRAAYRTSFADITVPADAIHLPLSDAQARVWASSLLKTLRLPALPGKSAEDGLNVLVAGVLQGFRPSDFIRLAPPSDDRTLVLPPSVKLCVDIEDKTPAFFRVALSAGPVALLDTATGRVSSDEHVTGIRALNMAFPLGDTAPEQLASWRHTIPDNCPPERPSAKLFRAFPHINDLGHRAGMSAYIDAVVLLDHMRNRLGGSEVGGVLGQEFPLVFVYPMGSTEEETTNQGKTTLARVLGGAMIPGIQVVNMSRRVGAPELRSSCEAIFRDGACVYDEFLIPTAGEHPLGKEGLQSLATGGSISVGRVRANATSLSLKHPLLFTAKTCNFPADIRNRQVPIFVDSLPPNRDDAAVKDLLAKVASGYTAMDMFLSTEAFIATEGLVDRVRGSKLELGSRFNAHLTVAAMFASVDEILAYLSAAETQCQAQGDDASDSGLADAIGAAPGVNIRFLLDSITNPDYLEPLIASSDKRELYPYAFARGLHVAAGNDGPFKHAGSAVSVGRDVIKQVTRLTRKGPVKYDGFTLHGVSDGESKGAGRKKVYIQISRS